MEAPLVSVILTVFKQRPYLGQAIQSVLGQSFSDFELIVTDDAACESTRRICEFYSADSRVRYRSNPRTLGPLLNIAAALEKARGEFVSILNDDDQLEPDMLESLVPPLLREPRCVLSLADHWIVDSSGEPVAGLCSSTSRLASRLNLTEGVLPAPFSFALRSGVLIGMGALFRRSALRQEWFGLQAGGAYDVWLGIQLSAAGSLYYVPRRLVRYRVHPDSESARVDPEKVQGEIVILEALLKRLMSPRDRVYVTKQLAASLFTLGRERLYFNNSMGARSAFIRSLRVKAGIKAAIGVGSSYLPRAAVDVGVQFWRSIRGIPSRTS
jgi:glycosyltransferase involved in cell wall biosynthesis